MSDTDLVLIALDDHAKTWARGVALEQAVQSMSSTDAYGVTRALSPNEAIETAAIYADWILTGETTASRYRKQQEMHEILRGVIPGGN